jgi:hypothetical protein
MVKKISAIILVGVAALAVVCVVAGRNYVVTGNPFSFASKARTASVDSSSVCYVQTIYGFYDSGAPRPYPNLAVQVPGLSGVFPTNATGIATIIGCNNGLVALVTYAGTEYALTLQVNQVETLNLALSEA